MLFIPITIAAAALQVARNAMQRGLLDGGGPWAATLVRFLFGLPFSLLFLAAAWIAAPDATPNFSATFWLAAGIACVAQIGATAALLVSIKRAGFGLAAVFQQSSLPFAALMGLVIGEGFTAQGWLGVVLTTGGLAVLAWPKEELVGEGTSGVWLGLLSGGLYGVCLIGFRVANLAVEPGHPVLGAMLTMAVSQAFQSAGMVAWLRWRDPAALRAVLRAWRRSFGAGFYGAAASACWLTALGMAPAGQVRAVGVAEMPIAALAGRKLFAERMSLSQVILSAAVAIGVVLAALG